MPIVFVTQDTSHNLTPALKHGEIQVLTMRDFPLWDRSLGRQSILETKRILEDYNPDQDFILPLGDPIAIGVAFALVIQKHGRVRILKWDRQTFSYNPLEIAV